MTKIEFLTLSEVITLHTDQIVRYGGDSGIRDFALLESAISMPGSGFGDEYLHEDIYEMAAAYLFHLCQNHPFVDGTKRIALASCIVFLDINGIILLDVNQSLYDLVIAVATGKIQDKKEIAEFLKKLVVR